MICCGRQVSNTCHFLAGWQWVSHLFIYSLSDRSICYFGSPAATFPSCLHPRFPWKLSRPSPYGTLCGALSLDTLDRGFDSHLANCTVFTGHRDWPGDGHVTHAEPMRCKEARMDLSEAGTGFMTDEPWGSGTLGLHQMDPEKRANAWGRPESGWRQSSSSGTVEPLKPAMLNLSWHIH